jgi:solute carrier family 25 carnitine/acylcarnitine transporter 20/29
MLVSAHLLSASSKADLENVLLHHALDTVEYSSSLQNGSQRTFATLEGTDLLVDRKNGTVFISSSGGWEGMKAELYPRNHLTQTGVVHELSDILIPRSVQLTVGKLVKAAKGSTMTSMTVRAGFEWVLNGTAPPEGSPWANQSLSGAGWTLLCPTDDAFKDLNLTQLYADTETLRSIVSQHLIPSPPSNPKSSILSNDALYNNRPLPLDNSATYSTLRSSAAAYGDIVFRRTEDEDVSEYVVGIKGARGTAGRADWARVRSWGRSTTGNGGGVIQIDRLLMPYYPPWWITYGAPTGMGFVGSVVICLFFYGVRLVWRKDPTEATYEPQGGFGHDDDEP